MNTIYNCYTSAGAAPAALPPFYDDGGYYFAFFVSFHRVFRYPNDYRHHSPAPPILNAVVLPRHHFFYPGPAAAAQRLLADMGVTLPADVVHSFSQNLSGLAWSAATIPSLAAFRIVPLSLQIVAISHYPYYGAALTYPLTYHHYPNTTTFAPTVRVTAPVTISAAARTSNIEGEGLESDEFDLYEEDETVDESSSDEEVAICGQILEEEFSSVASDLDDDDDDDSDSDSYDEDYRSVSTTSSSELEVEKTEGTTSTTPLGVTTESKPEESTGDHDQTVAADQLDEFSDLFRFMLTDFESFSLSPRSTFIDRVDNSDNHDHHDRDNDDDESNNDDDDDDDDDGDDVFEEDFDTDGEDYRIVPARQSSITSLEEVTNIMGCNGTEEKCSVCLDDFSSLRGLNLDGDDRSDGDHDNDRTVVLSRMPCSHLFHKECIVTWLQRNHLCPLCRYAMPTATESSESSSDDNDRQVDEVQIETILGTTTSTTTATVSINIGQFSYLGYNENGDDNSVDGESSDESEDDKNDDDDDNDHDHDHKHVFCNEK